MRRYASTLRTVVICFDYTREEIFKFCFNLKFLLIRNDY